VPLIAIVPLLALVGVFGEARTTATTVAQDVVLEVEHAERVRHSMPAPLTVTVHNRGTTTLEDVVVRVERRYLDAFTEVSFTPSAASVAEDYVIELGDIGAGDERRVAIDGRARSYWAHDGAVDVDAAGAGLSVRVGTLVLP
jgi:hypothetical protein